MSLVFGSGKCSSASFILGAALSLACSAGCALSPSDGGPVKVYRYPDDDPQIEDMMTMARRVLEWNTPLRSTELMLSDLFPKSCAARLEYGQIGWWRYRVIEALIDHKRAGWLLFSIDESQGFKPVIAVRRLDAEETRQLSELISNIELRPSSVRGADLFLPPDPPFYFLTVNRGEQTFQVQLHPQLVKGSLARVGNAQFREEFLVKVRALVHWLWDRAPLYDARAPSALDEN